VKLAPKTLQLPKLLTESRVCARASDAIAPRTLDNALRVEGRERAGTPEHGEMKTKRERACVRRCKNAETDAQNDENEGE